MKIESVDFFYLSMPEVLDIGDGSQDALLVRVRAGSYEGWGECEASPLASIAAYVCPMSHSACKPVSASVIGQELNSVGDIARIGNVVRENSFDLLQADHTLSGIDIALWDLMGKRFQEPVYRILGYDRAYAKLPYASQLFGDTPDETFQKARAVREAGFRAAKFGWGPYGKGSPEEDAGHVYAARRGFGNEGTLLVDAGTVWGEDVDAAQKRLAALEDCAVRWLEEPMVTGALDAYRELANRCETVGLAGGEGCHNYYQAKNMIDYAGLKFIQVDTGRIGGITDAKRAADYACEKAVTYVNHTFTTPLALSASLQPYAGMKDHLICEYPIEPKALAAEICKEKLLPGSDGMIRVPEKPGLGITPDPAAIKRYMVQCEIKVDGKHLYESPDVCI